MLNRRHFLGAGLASATGLTFSSVWSQNTPQFGAPDLPSVGFRRMKLGTMEAIALNDGGVRRPLGQEFVPAVPLDHVKALLASQNLPTDHIDVPYAPFLLINGNQRYLFDMNPEMARQTRRKIFDMLVKEKIVAGGFHFPFPFFGSITPSGNGYQFVPMA